jgi:hypothetical protein
MRLVPSLSLGLDVFEELVQLVFTMQLDTLAGAKLPGAFVDTIEQLLASSQQLHSLVKGLSPILEGTTFHRVLEELFVFWREVRAHFLTPNRACL